MEWLCAKNFSDLTATFEINECAVDECKTYSDWSDWSPCSRICGGYTFRNRSCFDQKNCDTNFLSQIKLCQLLENCESNLIGKKYLVIHFFIK
jgi:hypothetical protein